MLKVACNTAINLYNGSAPKQDEPAHEYDIRGLVINRDSHKCFLFGREVQLTPLEFSILWYLCERQGVVVPSKEGQQKDGVHVTAEGALIEPEGGVIVHTRDALKQRHHPIGKAAPQQDRVGEVDRSSFPIERKLNLAKRTIDRQKSGMLLAEQKKNDLVMYLAHDLKTPQGSSCGTV